MNPKPCLQLHELLLPGLRENDSATTMFLAMESGQVAARGADQQMNKEVQASVGKAKEAAAGRCHIGHSRLFPFRLDGH